MFEKFFYHKKFLIYLSYSKQLDGDALTLPLIFEDKFEIGPHIGSNEPTPTMLMNGGLTLDRSRTQSILSNRSMNGSLKLNPKQPQCSCKIEPDTLSCKYVGGVTTPRFALGRDILQASLTIIPQAAQVNLRGTNFARNGISMTYGNYCGDTCGVLPTRHSKSLDQLEQEPNCVTPRSETFYGRLGNEDFLYKTLQVLEVGKASQDLGLPLKKRQGGGVQQREDLLKNINEFKQKYKNPSAQSFNYGTAVVNLNDIELTQLISTEAETGETKCTLTLDRFTMKRGNDSNLTNKQTVPFQNGGFHFNSLPKNSTINGSTPPRQKRYSKHHSTRSNRDLTGSFSTLPRSKSTQNVNRQKNQQQRSHHSFRYSRVRIQDYKHSVRKKSRSRRSVASQQECSSSSTESEKGLYERCKMPRVKSQKKILSSVSVPHQLEHLNGIENEPENNLSDSIPSSSSSSPRLVKSESLKINGDRSLRKTSMDQNDMTQNTYGYLTNGRRLTSEGIRQKRISVNVKKGSEKSKSEFDLPNANVPTTVEDLKLVPPEQFRDTIFTPLPPEEFRDSDEINHNTNNNNNKNGIDDLPLDPPRTEEKRMKPKKVAIPTGPTLHNIQLLRQQQQYPVFKAQAIDNPLYHMCNIGQQLPTTLEIDKTQAQAKIITKSQSTNELFGMERNNSYNASRMSLNNGCSHSNSPKSLQKSDTLSIRENSQSSYDKTSIQPPLLEFEKCREEFRKQVNYMGSIYSDFTKLASELPYFYISDELRVFSPNGLHLIVCVHGKMVNMVLEILVKSCNFYLFSGLDGNANDLRLFRTYLELGLPGANLDFLMSERNQGDTFSDFDTMTER